MVEICDRYLEKWSELGEFTWFPLMKQMTFALASALLLGSQPGEETERLSKLFTQLTQGLFAFPLPFPWTTYSKALKARDQLLDQIETAIQERRQNPRNDALGLLIQSRDESGNALSEAEIKVQALLMLFAGHETTTSMLISLAMSLAQYPDVWQKARAEQEAISSETLTFEHLKQMPYLAQILKEIERLYPPVGGGFRGVVKPFNFQGYHVPAGWKVLYQMKRAHQDSNIYPHPEQFDPDRFSPERNENKKVEYSLVGFGGGPRIFGSFCPDGNENICRSFTAKLSLGIVAQSRLNNGANSHPSPAFWSTSETLETLIFYRRPCYFKALLFEYSWY